MSERLNKKEKFEIAIESGLQLIPYVGGPISSLYFSTKQAKEFKRIERFYNELKEELDKVKSKIKSIDNQYEDGLISLIEQVNDKVEKEHQKIKFQSYKKFMKNILIDPVSVINYDKRETFLDIIGNMSILECKLLSIIYRNKDYIRIKDLKIYEVNQYVILGAVNKLKSYGFLMTSQDTISLYGGDNYLNERVCISDYGKEFVEFTLDNERI